MNPQDVGFFFQVSQCTNYKSSSVSALPIRSYFFIGKLVKPQDYVYPNRPVHKLEMGFPFPLPIQSYSFHWKTRDTIRLRLSKYAVAENWIFVST